ncbi:TadE/TadG family type IV pilus assembly protein [Nocardiopsis sp. NPDC006139]|uniref:TadE/TadG family type IV pilus assembly protein n=1 Tax=Nocardiopsis sp. NPDC006139 TaxID=3154578 RepID=UPI0033A127BC
MTGDDRGSATLELAVLSIGLLMVVSLIIGVGRVQVANHGVEEAARSAAREASIARTTTQARSDALTAATTTLADQGMTCLSLSVEVDVSAFTKPAGTPGSVTAHVSCDVALADLLLPGLPGTLALDKTFSSPVDTYRETSR